MELAAHIVLDYPVKEDEEVDIGIPTAKIVNTKTFKKWAAMPMKKELIDGQVSS